MKLMRWRGHLNAKDIMERVIAGIIAGVVGGSTFFILEHLFG